MASPLDDIRALARSLPAPDIEASLRNRRRLESEIASETLLDLAAWLCAWPGGPDAVRRGVRRPILSLYIASSEAVADAPARARARLETLSAGGGGVSTLARGLGAGVEIFDLGLERPAPDAAERPVMTERECAATCAFGMEALAKSPDVLVLSDLTEAAEAGAALLEQALGHPADVAALPAHMHDYDGDPLQALRRLGGRGCAAMVGAILAARVQGVPVILDGAAARAAARVCKALNPDALAHVRLADGAAENPLGLVPLTRIAGGGGGESGLAALALVKLAGDLTA
jgi:nicotinate-nucleotide--dimethylbenzimidazole phosphoribosyltransferase